MRPVRLILAGCTPLHIVSLLHLLAPRRTWQVHPITAVILQESAENFTDGQTLKTRDWSSWRRAKYAKQIARKEGGAWCPPPPQYGTRGLCPREHFKFERWNQWTLRSLDGIKATLTALSNFPLQERATAPFLFLAVVTHGRHVNQRTGRIPSIAVQKNWDSYRTVFIIIIIPQKSLISPRVLDAQATFYGRNKWYRCFTLWNADAVPTRLSHFRQIWSMVFL